MQTSDFEIGAAFEFDGKAYRCTDIGTRVVVAVASGRGGAAAGEIVFDEIRQARCQPRRGRDASTAAAAKRAASRAVAGAALDVLLDATPASPQEKAARKRKLTDPPAGAA